MLFSVLTTMDKELLILIKRYWGDTGAPPELHEFIESIDTILSSPGRNTIALGSAHEGSSSTAITTHQELKNLLQDSTSRIRLLEDNITDVIWISDMSFGTTYISPSIYRISGYTAEEITPLPRDKIFTRETLINFANRLKKELDLEKTGSADPKRFITVDGQEICKDGTIIDIEMKVTFLRDGTGSPMGILGVTRDITERKKSEQALRKSEEKNRAILENMREGYFEVDLMGTYTYVNEAACRIIGYSREEIIGASYKNHYMGEQAERMYRIFNTVYTTGKPVDLTQFKLKSANGGIKLLEASVNLMKDDSGEKYGFFGILRDMTERIKLEEALRKRNAIMENDLAMAQLIIKAIFTEEIPRYGRLTINYRYLPLEALGGDFFSFKELEEGGLSIFLCDVASHGVTAGLFIALVKAMIDRVYRIHPLEPDNFMKRLNTELYGHMPLSFLSAIYGVFAGEETGANCRFTFSVSGHPCPILYHGDTQEVELIECRGYLLGMIEDIDAQRMTLELRHGDRLFLYTDGLPETMNGDGKIWGYDSLQDLFSKSMKQDLADSLDAIIDELNRWRGDTPFEDDIILLGIEVQ